MTTPLPILVKFCRAFNISAVDCTCKNEMLRKALIKFPYACEEPSATPETTFRYNDISKVYGIVGIFASLIGLIGNSLVMLVGWRNRRTFLTCQKLIAVLALCDVVFAIAQLIMSFPALWTLKWLYGDVMCKLLNGAMFLGAVIAVGFIMIISIERFLGVLKPMSKTFKLIVGLSLGNVVIGILSAIPILAYVKVNSQDRCELDWPSRSFATKYYMASLFILNILPVSVVFCLYAYIVHVLRRGLSDKTMQEAMDQKFYNKRKNEYRRVLKIVLALVIAFICLVFPNRIITLYLHEHQSINADTYYALALIAVITYPFHVAINPFLYCFIDPRWRKAMQDVFRSRIQNRFRASTGNEYTLGSPISEHNKQFKRVETFQTIAASDDTMNKESFMVGATH